ncbi:hypothetical protein JX266_005157 [Neoarthrinium moseri]|nr:hypothetical protein JX266_005157 [Neoarthrinium moseri]
MRRFLRTAVGRWDLHGPAWRPAAALMRRYSEVAGLYGATRCAPDFEDDEDRSDYRLWCTRDGRGSWVPFPFDPQSKPYVDWSWWHLDQWMQSRGERMRHKCNADWETDSDVSSFQLNADALPLPAPQGRRGRVCQAEEDPSLPDRDPPAPRPVRPLPRPVVYGAQILERGKASPRPRDGRRVWRRPRPDAPAFCLQVAGACAGRG